MVQQIRLTSCSPSPTKILFPCVDSLGSSEADIFNDILFFCDAIEEHTLFYSCANATPICPINTLNRTLNTINHTCANSILKMTSQPYGIVEKSYPAAATIYIESST